MTAVKSMDMELTPYDLSFLDGEPQNSSSVRGDQMVDYGTFGNLSDAFLPNEICKGSDLFLFNPPSLNTTTNREGIASLNPLLSEPIACQDSAFSFDRKLYTSPSYTDDDFYSIEKYLSDEQGFPSLLNCGNLSPLSSEDVESILDTASLSDDGDISLSPGGSAPASPELQVALSPAAKMYMFPPPSPSSPSLFHHLIRANESDVVQTTEDAILDVSYLGYATTSVETSRSNSPCSWNATSTGVTSRSSSPCSLYATPTVETSRSSSPCSLYATPTVETSRSSSPCSLVSSPGKEKRPKSYRTKKTPYSWDQCTESIPSPIDNDDDDLDPPNQRQLSKKEKKKLQNKNAATKYRQKMKEESEVRKSEEDGLLMENRRLKNRVDEIQKEIQYLKNLQKEIGNVRT